MRQERARHSSLQHAVRKRREGNKVNSLMQEEHAGERCLKRNMRIVQEKKMYTMISMNLKNAVRGVVFRQRAHVGQPRCNAGVLGKVFLNHGELRNRCDRRQAQQVDEVKGYLKQLFARAEIGDAWG